ncbi:MAG TPA: hypothetical protein VF516_06830, partial [Kofleriaceae bacterium]
MSRLDVYLRSIKQLGALGAVLTSGQAVTLRFPTGDRHATQITAHDQLVSLVREIAPPAALEQIDRGRPASFELEASGGRWAIQVVPRPGAWHVAIDPIDPSPSSSSSSSSSSSPSSGGAAGPPVRPTPRPGTMGPGAGEASEMANERGPAGVHTTSGGSALLDHLTAGGRAVYASDIYLNAGVPAFQRIGGELAATADRAVIDGDTLARELGQVAPSEARSAWAERGLAVFAYG